MTTGLLSERATATASTHETRTDNHQVISKLTLTRPAETLNSGTRLAAFPLVFSALGNDDFASTLRRLFPETRTAILAQARDTLKHRFTLQGGVQLSLGPQIDWERDPKSGARWERDNRRNNCTCRPDSRCDLRHIWALSRGHEMAPMAIAGVLEGRADYADEIERQMCGWIAQNRVGDGVNWLSPAEAAIRAINWLEAYSIVCRRRPREPEFAELLHEHLVTTGIFIRSRLQAVCCGHNDYRYLANLVGLLFLGELCHDLEFGKEWREFALREIESECRHQFGENGLLRQSSLAYHGFATELILHALLLERHCAWRFSDSLKQRFARMLDILALYSDESGALQAWGDSEELRVANWCARDPRDFGDVMALGRWLLDATTEDRALSQAEELLIAGGSGRTAPACDFAGSQSSFHLQESGLCRLKSKSWQVDFFADTERSNSTSSHQHNDLLSLTASYYGVQVLIDSGTFSYNESDAMRTEFRGTAAHNSVMVDREEQRRSVSNMPFLLRPDACGRVSLWQTNVEHDLVVAEHDGYRRLGDPVLHRRAVCMLKETEVLLIKDELRGEDTHLVETFFHLGEVQIQTLDSRSLILRLADQSSLLLTTLNPEIEFTVNIGWRSPAYDAREPGLVVAAAVESQLPATFVYALAPLDLESAQRTRLLAREAAAEFGWL